MTNTVESMKYLRQRKKVEKNQVFKAREYPINGNEVFKPANKSYIALETKIYENIEVEMLGNQELSQSQENLNCEGH